MTNNSFQFSLLKTDGGARRGRLNTRQGSGFEFQIAHVRDCINDQMSESEIMPFKYSFGFQQLMEEIDRQARR